MPDVEEEIVAARERAARAATIMSSPPAASVRPMTTSPPMRSRKAFGVPIDEDPRALAMMMERYKPGRFQCGAPAHGAHSGRRRTDRKPDLQGAGLPDRQCHRDGRRARRSCRRCSTSPPKTLKTGAMMLAETIEAGGIPEGRYGERAGRDRRRPSGRVDRLLSVFRDGRFQQPDRGARQGRGRSRRGRGRAVEAMVAGARGRRLAL